MFKLDGKEFPQDFAFLTNYHDSSFQLDGKFGLGFSVLTGKNNVLESLFSQGIITQKVFSLYLKEGESSLVFGEPDLKTFASNPSAAVNYVYTVNPAAWQFQISQLGYNSISKVYFSTMVFFSISQETFQVARTAVPTLKDLLPKGFKLSGDSLESNCTSVNDFSALEISIGDHTLSIEPSAYITQKQNTCVINTSEHWVLGTHFFKKYYTIFDLSRKRLGFTQAATSPNQDNSAGMLQGLLSLIILNHL